MKKLIKVLLVVLVLFMAASCGNKETDTADSEPAKPVLKLGFDAEYPPFGYLNAETGEYEGFDIDLAKAVCEDIGYELELIPIDWDAKDAELNSKAIDCIWSGFTINGREDLYAWTDAYVDNSIVILTTADAGIETLADLEGKYVTVQMDSSAMSALDDMADLVGTFAGGSYQMCPEYNTAFNELNIGSVDAIAIDVNVAKYLIDGKEGYTVLAEQVSSEQYGVGFRTDDTALCEAVNNSMKKLAGTGLVMEIAKNYGIEDSICIK